MNIPAWVEPYINLPFIEGGDGPDGFDCGGLVRHVYEREKSVRLPSYSGPRSNTDIKAVARGLGTLEGYFRRIPLGEEMPFDILRILKWGAPCHVALVIVPGAMLHTEADSHSCWEEYRTPDLLPRIEGVFRYELHAS
jgi:cell wall-associated NlpC family hydrolase